MCANPNDGAQQAVLWTDCEHGVAPAEWAAYTLACSDSYTHVVFKALAEWLVARRGSNQRRRNWQLKESDSLAQGRTRTFDTRPQCDLVNVRHE